MSCPKPRGCGASLSVNSYISVYWPQLLTTLQLLGMRGALLYTLRSLQVLCWPSRSESCTLYKDKEVVGVNAHSTPFPEMVEVLGVAKTTRHTFS